MPTDRSAPFITEAEHRVITESVSWDATNWSKCLAFWRQASRLANEPSRPLKALEIGAEANAGLSLWMAYLGMDVLCSGLRPPSDSVRAAHDRFEVPGSIRYAQLDVMNMDDVHAFDVIAMKSVIGGIGAGGQKSREPDALNRVYQALRPGGELWLAENVEATAVHRFLRNRHGWGKHGQGWHYLRLPELRQLLDPFAEYEVATFGFLGLLGRTESQRRFLGRVDTVLFDRTLPSTWRYIAAIVARKQ